MSAPPSLVLFDLDGVLVDYDSAARVTHLAAALGVEPAAVHAALFDSGLEDRFDAGEIDTDAYLEAIGAPFGRRVDRAVWCDARAAAMRLDPCTPARVATVAARCDVAVLTNNGGLLVDTLPAMLPSLAAVFGERVFASARLGARKPAPRVYLQAVALLGHAPGTTLFLDDARPPMSRARRAGLQSAHVAGPEALAGVLAAYGFG
ncbi:MAG TPA: HAD-IA family hydrolase [Lysobacter sp.]|nr:HAD-IA family hydrolase [Lysobacter sp.]